MENGEDITDKTKIQWTGGRPIAYFYCECGKWIPVQSGIMTECSCGRNYWLATRLMRMSDTTPYAHDHECDCAKCDAERAAYQANFEDEHDH